MPFVVRREEQYQRIDTPSVQLVALRSAEASDSDALLEKTQCLADDEEQNKALRLVSKNRTLAIARKFVQPGHRNMKLRIHRMDNTTFVVEVSKKATISELKGAVQRKFEASETGCQISWPHVWGHFCLSFRNQKLLDDSAVLHQLGLGETDELYFVRHVATRPASDYGRRGFFSGLRKNRGLN